MDKNDTKNDWRNKNEGMFMKKKIRNATINQILDDVWVSPLTIRLEEIRWVDECIKARESALWHLLLFPITVFIIACELVMVVVEPEGDRLAYTDVLITKPKRK